MALEIGSRLGHYNVTALIGEGGMGPVHLSRRMHRPVSVLVIMALGLSSWAAHAQVTDRQPKILFAGGDPPTGMTRDGRWPDCRSRLQPRRTVATKRCARTSPNPAAPSHQRFAEAAREATISHGRLPWLALKTSEVLFLSHLHSEQSFPWRDHRR